MNHPPRSPACALCHRLFTPDSDELQPIPICGDCKFFLLDDPGSPVQDDYRAMLHRLRGGSSESLEASFSHAYDSSISLGVFVRGCGSRRWRRGLSDTESDGFDSFLGESGSNFSFGSSRFYHDENDSISADENEDFSQPGGASGNTTDSDIDPMHAGLHHWNSQDVEEDDVEEYIVWEETETFADIQAREFDEHLAEADSSRRGAPPAAISFVRALPRLVVTEDPQKPHELACAICKDPLHVGAVVNQLPCSHRYHPACILPWLSSRNSCPLCRYELPTDDRDYEDRKQTLRVDSSELEGVRVNGGAGRENRGRRGWTFLAAPVVGAILMLCLGSQAERRRRTTGRRGQNRGWWGFLF